MRHIEPIKIGSNNKYKISWVKTFLKITSILLIDMIIKSK